MSLDAEIPDVTLREPPGDFERRLRACYIATGAIVPIEARYLAADRRPSLPIDGIGSRAAAAEIKSHTPESLEVKR